MVFMDIPVFSTQKAGKFSGLPVVMAVCGNIFA